VSPQFLSCPDDAAVGCGGTSGEVPARTLNLLSGMAPGPILTASPRAGCDAVNVADHATTGARTRPPLVRRTEGRLVAGVSGGIARHLGVNVAIVRVAFALLAVNGVGAIAYLAAWLLVPDESDDGSGRTRLRRPRDVVRAVVRDRPGDDPHRRRKLLAYVLLGMAAGSVFGALGVNIGGRSGLPLLVAGIGALLIWSRAPEAQREQWTTDARRYGSRLGRRGPLLVMLGGVGLVVVGVAAFLAAHDALAQARAGALAIGATVVGVLLVTGPWLFRLLRELTAERRARIREHERAEVAAHVHDSVLQTLALIQSQAADPDAVRRLARRQERELRGWLYTPATSAEPAADPTLASALRAAAADVEDSHGVSVDVVVVGDAALDEGVAATVAAAKEAMVNAAKASGAPVVSLFAEVGPAGVEVFVRDRGCGFDPALVPGDRRGIRDSIVGRMARHGGTATVRSGDTGTEVALTLARKVTA
jgi:signal transduction histidine kinase/phage shock protein PspC (stress-responsive transcriptional regulator)